MLDDESPKSANLGNDHGFINKEYSLYWFEAFWGSPKQSHESLCSKWTISYYCEESCSSNIHNWKTTQKLIGKESMSFKERTRREVSNDS